MKPTISSIFKFRKTILLAFCLGFLLTVVALPGQADAALVTGSSYAYIDWTSLTFSSPSNFAWVAGSEGNQSGIDLGLNDEHDPYNTNSIDGAFGTTSASNSVTATDLSAGASASMTTTPTSAVGSANASVNATGVGISDVFLANAVFTRDFEISVAGTLTATADYWLSAHVTSDNTLSYVRSDVFAGLYVYDFEVYDIFESDEVAPHRTINGQVDTKDLNTHGTLNLTILLENPGTYTFEASAGTIEHLSSAVPIPSTLLLLGSGLFGLVGFRRRFNNPLN